MTRWVALFAMLGLFALGCESKPEQPSGGAAPAPTAKAPAPVPAPTPPPASAPAPAPDTKAAAPAAGGAIGVAECDDYIKKMETCITKAPAAAKPGMTMGLKTSRETWAKIAAGPGKAGLATGCKAAADAMAANPVCK